MTTQILDSYITEIIDEILAIRRHLHQHPELSFKEWKTSQFVFDELTKLGLNPQRIGETGVTAIISNANHDLSKGCVGLRADLDALPIQENTGLDFESQNKGIMHACGHDVHTAILLGTARVLMRFKDHLNEPIKLIFQPGEEVLPGGASILIHEGVLENPKVNRIYGLHVAPELEIGEIGWRKGVYMASCDEIYLDIIGKGGHGALPQNCIDPIAIGATVVSTIQQVISRKGDPRIPSVLTFGHFEALGATNVIPSVAKLKGTFRTFDENWRKKAHQWMTDYIVSTCEMAGAKAELRIEKGYPFLNNDEHLVSEFVMKLTEKATDISLIPLDIRMTSEDFAYYSQQIPACFFRLGTSNKTSDTQFGVHNSKFKIDERAITYGIKTFSVLFIDK